MTRQLLVFYLTVYFDSLIVLVLPHLTLIINHCPVRDLRTIIVIADIDRGLYNASNLALLLKDRSYLTFRHWSGITPYTSSYEFAGSCVFGKQSLDEL